VFGYPDVPFSQPRHVVLGHLFCVLVGLAAFHFLGSAPWVLALAVGTAAAGMMALRIMHPPATSNPIIVFLGKAAWGFALFPTLAGAILIVLVALAWNNGVRRTRYPSYW
jgi:CBS-domain-containing membrane protein